MSRSEHPSTASSAVDRRTSLWPGFGFFGLAFALRWLDLGRRVLWSDEAATWYFGGLIHRGQLGAAIGLEPTPPLYYAVAGAFERWLGPSDIALRFPSVLFGALAAAGAWWAGRRLFGEVAGRVAGLLVAIHPLLVFLGREARVYPLASLLVLLLLATLVPALDGGSRRRWAAITGLAAVLCYSHFYGLFVLMALFAAAGLFGRSRRDRWHGMLAACLAGLLFAPYVLATLPSLRDSGADWSVGAFYEGQPEERSPLRVLENQAIGALRHPFQRHLAVPNNPGWIRWPSLAAQGLLLAASLAVLFAAKRRPGREDRRGEEASGALPPRAALGLAALFWLVPVVVPWIVTHVFGRPIFQSGRHDAFVVPVACLLLGAGASRLWRVAAPGSWSSRIGRPLLVLSLALLVAVSGLRLVLLHTAPDDRTPSEVGSLLAAEATPEDLVVAFGLRRLVVERYLRMAESGEPVPVVSFPASTDSHPGWADLLTLRGEVPALEREAVERVAVWTADPPRHLFLLLRFLGTPEEPTPQAAIDVPLLRALARAGWRADPDWPAPDQRHLQVERWSPPEARAALGETGASP